MQRFLLAVSIVVGSVALADARAPSMSSAWSEMEIDQDTCIKHASAIMRGTQFTTGFEVLRNNSVFGERGDYTALIRCATERKIVYFVVAGITAERTTAYMNAMRDAFKEAANGGTPTYAVLPDASSNAVIDNLPGDYSCNGANPNGSTYSCNVNISRSGDLYQFRWRIADGTRYSGSGRLRGRTLTVNWGQSAPVIYQVGDDGVLRGTWANGRARETLTPDR